VPGIHPTAWISPAARIGQNVSIGAFSYIGEDVEIGDNVVIHPLVSVYPEARIGERTILHSHVSIREGVRLGKGVIVHNGAVIGSDGFGYLKLEDGTHLKIPQLGSVIVEDNVEIGANTAVDRAALDETMIGKGTKIDNLIQIAHNVEIGRNGILAAQTGIAGSSKIGHNVVMGGQVGIPDHITIGDNVIVMAQAGVTKDLPDGSIVVGSPHMKVRDFWKMWAALGQLYDLIRDFKALQKKIEELEKRLK
jgi:UDP-3-O-[3-hydroxymyristoyl] glucosamine N-acyltransferase